ncbi:hypothetical protein ACF09H_05660 [Streptomyces sp. NPDC014983]|uniref:hypothetical protein n=1 Tax=unclassified Streptomyces TaxID=2593676 RepID=UPI00332D5596
MLEAAMSAGRQLAPGAPADGQEEAARWLRREAAGWLAALRAAAAADAHPRVMEAAESLRWAAGWWSDEGLWDEVFDLGRQAARRLEDLSAEAAFLNDAARHHLVDPRRHQQARVCAAAAVVCADRVGDAEQAAWGRLHAAMAVSLTDRDLAVAQAHRAAARFESLGHPEGTLRALAVAARTLSSAGRHEEARTYLRRLRVLCSGPLADGRLRRLAASTLAWACLLDGEALAVDGRWEDAECVYRQGLADLGPTAAAGAEVLLCLGLAGVLRRRPEGASQGAALLRRALDAARQAQDVQCMTRVLRALDDWAVTAR